MTSRRRGSSEFSGSGERLSILLLDYEMAREDERTFNSIQAAMFGVAVALVAGLAALLTKACAFQPDRGVGSGQQCTHVPEGVLVVTPLAPFALVIFVLVLGLVATVRSYYLRALEAELQHHAGPALTALDPIRPGAYTELMSEMVSLRRGERGYPFLVLVIVLAGLVIFGGFIVYIFSGVAWFGRVAMLILYGPAMLFVLVQAVQGTVGGRGLFNHVAGSYIARLNQGESSTVPSRDSDPKSPRRDRERSLASYLLLPRPEELPKALFAPVVFCIACLSLDSFSSDVVLRAAVVLFSLEYLIYEARYQWNDVRGVDTDHLHRDQVSRGRLPRGSNPPDSTMSHIRLSLLVAGLRLALVPAIAITVGRDTLTPVLMLMLAVFAVAVPYEMLRSVADDPAEPERRRVRTSRAIWALVGGGYMVRGLAGFCLAGYALLDPITGIAAVSFVSYGVLFVTMTWALEAVAHSVRALDGSLQDDPRNPPRFHVGLLRRWLKLPDDESPADLMYAKPLRLGGGSPAAPWNIALLCCGCFGGVLGIAVAAGGELSVQAAAVGAAMLLPAAATIVLGPAWRLLIYLATAAGLMVCGAGLGDGLFYLAALPWIFFAGLYLSFRGQSYHSLKRWVPDIPAAFEFVTDRLLVAFVGRRTMRSLQPIPEERKGG